MRRNTRPGIPAATLPDVVRLDPVDLDRYEPVSTAGERGGGWAGGLRVVGYDQRSPSTVRRDALRAKRWVEIVSRGGVWQGLPPRARPAARPVVEDGDGKRFVLDTRRDGIPRLRSYNPPSEADTGMGGFKALDVNESSAAPTLAKPPAGKRPLLLERLLNAPRHQHPGSEPTYGPADDPSSGRAVAGRGHGKPNGHGQHGDPMQTAISVASHGFSALLPSQGPGGGGSGFAPTRSSLGGLASKGADKLIGMGLDHIAKMAMSSWKVDDESSTGEHLAQMASKKLMGELKEQAKSALMEAAFGPDGPPSPGSSSNALDKARDYVLGKPRGAGIAIAHNANPTDHGGVLTATAATTMAGGLTVGRLNDVQACPLVNGSTPHVGGPVNTANPTVLAENLPVSGEDHTALCTGVGGQTLLKPTVQTVRIGPAGMPVAISSNGEDKNAAESEGGGEQAESQPAEQSEPQATEEQTTQDSTASEDSGSQQDPETSPQEPSTEQTEQTTEQTATETEQPQATGQDPETEVTEKLAVGMSEKGPYIEKSTTYEDEGSIFNTSTTNKVRGTQNPITGKGSVGGSTEGCVSLSSNPGDAVCITGGGSVGSDGLDVGAGITLKGGSVTGSVQVTPPPVKPTDYFGFDVEPSGAGSVKIRIPNPKNPATGLEASIGFDEHFCDGTIPWCDNFMGWPWEQ